MELLDAPFLYQKLRDMASPKERSKKQILGFFVQNYDESGSIKYKFKEFTGKDFCDVAEERGWIAIHLKLKNRQIDQN